MKTENELRSEIKENILQGRKDLAVLKAKVITGSQNIVQYAEESISIHQVESQIAMERITAEAKYEDELRQMRKQIEEETKELKTIISES